VSRADFYQLKSSDPASRYPLLCRLLEKAVTANQQVYVQCGDPAEASHLDQYIWAFKPDSFIDHVCVGVEAVAAVVLGHPSTPENDRPAHTDICINLSQVPAPETFERIIELVVTEPEMLQLTRDHYRFYQQNGRTMQYHKL